MRWTIMALAAACQSPAGTGPAPQDSSEPPSTSGGPRPSASIVPLFDEATPLEPELWFDRGDAVVTRIADRARDRHAREDEFHAYDHYLPFYWEYRTAQLLLVDTVAKGGQTIDVSLVSEWRWSVPEFRAWYRGLGTVASYSGNYAPWFVEDGPGTYDLDHVRVSDTGSQYRYTYTITSAITLDGATVPLAVGQFMEIESSQFLLAPPRGRENYYGTTLLYEVGVGGMVPWEAIGDILVPTSERENSHKLDERAWLGGRTTLPYMYSAEPAYTFMQMATQLSSLNGQPFVRGRRVHHTDMNTGSHDESVENGVFSDLVGLVGPRYIHTSCDACHTRNGRAPVAAVGEASSRWVFKVAGPDGGPDPALGQVLQPSAIAGEGEGEVSIAQWVEGADGLRAPEFAFSGTAPAQFSARLAPQLVGLGLLEAIPEATVLGWEDPDDADGDGISGRAQVVADPATAAPRLGRFGWKGATSSLTHQVAAALNTDMGVMTSWFPAPDCGSAQEGCGSAGAELADEHLSDLVKYIALLGVRARRDLDDPEALLGEALFAELGCEGCHRAEVTTSAVHPLAELRSQVVHPYTDLLLHDMGPGLADDLGEGEASGAEWRTAPLWGIGLGPCVTLGGGGPLTPDACAAAASYLHDGRARDLFEAIRWHGGEGEASRAAFDALSVEDQAAVVLFLGTL